MNGNRKSLSTGPVFLDPREIDIVEAANCAGNALGTLGDPVTRLRILSETEAHLTAPAVDLTLSLNDDDTAAVAATVLDLGVAANAIAPKAPAQPADIVLAYANNALRNRFAPDDLDSPEPDEQHELPENKLLAAPSAVTESATEWVLRDIFREGDTRLETTASHDKLREEDAANTSLRLAAWGVSLAFALIDPAVGAALFAYNLLRGADVRLACLTLALGMTFAGLSSAGVTATTLSALAALLGV